MKIIAERERQLASLLNLWAVEAKPANLVLRFRSLQLVAEDLGTSLGWSQCWLLETWRQ